MACILFTSFVQTDVHCPLLALSDCSIYLCCNAVGKKAFKIALCWLKRFHKVISRLILFIVPLCSVWLYFGEIVKYAHVKVYHSQQYTIYTCCESCNNRHTHTQLASIEFLLEADTVSFHLEKPINYSSYSQKSAKFPANNNKINRKMCTHITNRNAIDIREWDASKPNFILNWAMFLFPSSKNIS